MKHLRMPWLLRFVVATLSVLILTLNGDAQVQTSKYVSTTTNSGGYLEYLPSGYNNNQTYPLIIFIHGVGELGGGGPGDLERVLYNGLPRVINAGQFPSSFYVDGQNKGFIVISPQFRNWPTPNDVNA